MFRGTGRDNRLLEYLDQLPKLNDLAGPAKSHKRWIKGQGFQPAAVTHKRTRKEAWWDPEDLYISAQQPILFDTAYLLKRIVALLVTTFLFWQKIGRITRKFSLLPWF